MLRRSRGRGQSREARDCSSAHVPSSHLVDDIEASASGGDLNHALREGVLTKDQVHADLADLAKGHKIGRAADEDLVIFDSSGSGVQDVAAAWVAYREARRTGIGARFDLSGVAAD